jgi:hypothetical protein
MYRPLPDYLTIKPSGVEGLGMFATSPIPSGTNMGFSHHYIDGLTIRTPLGGFVNHEKDDPNCELAHTAHFASLISIKDIEEGEELTLCYKWYNPQEVSNV